MLLKIKNIVGERGVIDYKGLDIDFFVAGSQYYKLDNSFCVLETTEDEIPESEDVEVLSIEQYNQYVKDITNEFKEYKSEDAKRIDELTVILGDALLNGGV